MIKRRVTSLAFLLVVGSIAHAVALLAHPSLMMGASDPFSWTVLRRFSSSIESDARSGVPGVAYLALSGLPPGAEVQIDVLLSSRRPWVVRTAAGDSTIDTGLSDSPTVVQLLAETSALGNVVVRFAATSTRPGNPPRVRVHSVGVRRLRLSIWRTALLATGFTLLLMSVVWALGASSPARWALALAAASSVGLYLHPMAVSALLPAGAGVLWFTAALRGMTIAFRRSLGASRSAAWALALGIGIRVAFGAAFPGVDSTFHAHNTAKWRAGRTLASVAPGLSTPLPVPYPPGLYAVLGALFPPRMDELAMRSAVVLLEGSLPLFAWALARAGGLGQGPSVATAVAAAAMPMGVVALGKGIAANMLGQLTSIVAAAFLIRRRFVAAAIAVAGVLLSHFGATLSFLPLLACWPLIDSEVRPGGRHLRGFLGAVGAALVLAWLGYYSEVTGVMIAATQRTASATEAAAWGIEPVRAGKVAVGVLLEGALLPLLAVVGWRRGPALFRWWGVIAVLEGALALVSPVTLRWDYFGVPAAAALAAVAAQDSARWSRVFWVLVWTGLVLQAAMVIGLLTGGWDIINVVQESPRWPMVEQIRSLVGS